MLALLPLNLTQLALEALATCPLAGLQTQPVVFNVPANICSGSALPEYVLHFVPFMRLLVPLEVPPTVLHHPKEMGVGGRQVM